MMTNVSLTPSESVLISPLSQFIGAHIIARLVKYNMIKKTITNRWCDHTNYASLQCFHLYIFVYIIKFIS